MNNTPLENPCTLYIIRHGQTEWNVAGRLQGHADSPLTEEGVKQAETRAEELKHISFDAIFSSDSPRAHRTAEIIKLDRELVVQTSQLLREMNFGSFEGKKIAEFREALKDKMAELERLTDHEKWDFALSEEIETEEAVISRLLTYLREIALAYPNKTVLVVTHGAGLRTLLLKLGYATRTEIPHRAIANTAYAKVACDGINFCIQEVHGVTREEE